ncbi:hypothetical protein BC938DRAFT_477113 [Jimgerdemannia flammicorona]|uniref:Uncharacterized protein n=1 Tax=Jimgerdemannia flammicorona TaxID=994334 RepID=A0A433QPR2_9FUNG|nr:hypothetical protein BC938DRAFT_477113 [Jimgerdemannia flammicorona]
MVADKRVRTIAPEQELGLNLFLGAGYHVLNAHHDGVRGVIVRDREVDDAARSFHEDTLLLEVAVQDALYVRLRSDKQHLEAAVALVVCDGGRILNAILEGYDAVKRDALRDQLVVEAKDVEKLERALRDRVRSPVLDRLQVCV